MTRVTGDVIARTFAVALLCLALPAMSAMAVEKPSILFILTDDEGWGTLSCYGNKLVATPHLDALARDGLKLTSAYATPQCTPTRATLLTGQHTAHNRMWHVIPWYGTPWARVAEPAFQESLPRDAFTLPKGLKAAGYVTGIIGKWHLTTDRDGDYAGLKPSGAAAFGFDHAVPAAYKELKSGDKGVGRLTDEALRFIETHRDKRWFLYLAHHTAHRAIQAPRELVAKHRARGAPEKGLNNATYLAALEHLDNSIGRLLARLDELKLRENTLVVFQSDNGGVYRTWSPKPFTEGPGTATALSGEEQEFSNAPLREGKGSPYEGGLRVPCLVRWPGVVNPGTTADTPVHVVDWLPTLFEIAGASTPSGYPVDGLSLLPLLRGETLPSRPFYWYMPLYDLRWAATPCAVVRDGDWKLIEYFGDWFDTQGKYHTGHRLELFNLRDDLGEQQNLASKQPDRAAKLQSQLHGWLRSVNTEVPGPNPRYDPSRALKETRTKPSIEPK